MGVIAIATLLLFQWFDGGLSAGVSLPMTVALAALLVWQAVRLGAGAALAQRPALVGVEAMFAVAILVLLGSVTPGVASSLDPSASLVEIILLLGLACAFMLGMMAGASETAALLVVKALVVGGTGLAAYALIRFSPLGAPGGHAVRLSADYLAPNTAGAVFAALFVLATSSFFRRVKAMAAGEAWPRAALWALPVVIFGAAILATASRGAALACLAGLGLALAPRLRGAAKERRERWAVLAVLVVVGGLVVMFGGALGDRISADQAPANARGALAAMHWKLFLAQPLRGYGLGSFDIVNKTHLTPSTFGALWSMRAAHNLYLQWLEEAGVVVAILMAGCLATILAVALGAAARGRSRSSLLWSLLGVDAVFLVQGLGDFALQTPSVAMLWSFLLGLQFALALQPSGDRDAAFRRAPWHGGFGLLTGGVALVAWISLQCGGALKIGTVEVLPLAAGFDREASRLVRRPANPETLNAAEAASARALALAPYDTSAALRLAYIDVRRNGHLTERGEARLRESYDRVPLDQGVALWRIQFVLENWSRVTPATRLLAHKEFDALLSTGRHRRALLNMLAGVDGSEGAMIARFWASRVNLNG